MGEQYLTFTITSETPIDWAVGDFCEFRGETFTLNYVPSVTQKAGTNERQDAYTYENVKFDSFQEELTRCLMLDITASTGEYIAAQGTNYTGSSKFTLFCGETYANGATLTPVCVLVAKMQANLDRMYGVNGWKIFVDTTSTYINAAGDAVLVTHTEDKALNFDNTTVAQALAEVHNTFDLDYCIRGRNIYIGYNLKNLTSDNDNETFAFGYGKGYASRDNQNKALFQIKRIANPQQKIVTRLRAFGSTKNMPYRYYNRIYHLSQSLFPTNLQLPDTFEDLGTKNNHNALRDAQYGINPVTNLPYLRHVKGSTNDSYIDKGDSALQCPEGIREHSARWDGSDSNLPEIYPTIEEATYGELRGALVEDQDGRTGYGSFPNYSDSERIDKLLAIGYSSEGSLVDDANKGDGILPESGISSTGVPRNASIGATYHTYSPTRNGDFTYRGNGYEGKEKTLFTIQGVAPGKFAMAPTLGAVIYGFSLSCYRDGCSCDVGYKIQVKAKNVETGVTTTIASYTSDFVSLNRSDGVKEMELPELPDVKEQTPKVSQILVANLSDITVTFTPIIRNVTVPSGFTDSFSFNYQVGNSRLSHDVTAEPEYTWFPIDDSGNLIDRFHVFVQDMGFDIQACWTDETPVIAMKSGRCVGREFEILEDVQKVSYGNKQGYMLTLKRATDDSLHTYYPSQTDPIQAGDHFVMLGISMPDAYVKMAEVRLLRAATDYLADNCETKFTYQPYIDNLYLQRNLDAMTKANTPNKSIFWRLYAGLKFTFRGVPSSENEPAPLADITIEKVTISMGDGLTPKVELTLNDDVQQSTIQKLTTNVDRIYNGSIFNGGNVSGSSTAVGAAILSILESEGDKLFLSKKHDDVAEGKITFNDVVTLKETLKAQKGIKIGNYQSRFLGSGALIDEEGNAEFESIYSRNFISTPEFRFNRINVTEGEDWCTNGFGTIKEVEIIDETTGTITLKLEENDYASIKVGDICRGIYNDIAHQYETKTLEDDSELYDEEVEEETEVSDVDKSFGFSAKEGFFTSYFWVRQIITNEKGECKFIYELRNSKTPHPCEFMRFAQYGSFTDSDRRSSSYSTSIGHYYEMVLDGVNTWKIKSANVVYRKGYLGNMTVQLKNGKEAELQGYGLYVQDNVYFGNAVVQIDPETLADLEDKLKTYEVEFSDHVDVVTVDDVGNCIGGIYSVSGGYRSYRINSAITVRKNHQLLRIAADTDDAAEGTYKIYAQPRGCTCVIENSTIYITSIDNIKDGVAGSEDDVNFDYDAMREMDSCYVDLIIDCEGNGSIQKRFPIRILHSATPYVDATINNQFSAVSWNTKIQQYIGLPIPIKVKLWHNNEQLKADSVAINGVTGATLAETSKTITVDGMSIETALTRDSSGDYININIVSLPSNLSLVSVLNITATTEYAGVPYERTITHTINKNTDVNVYSLAPSVTDIVYNPNSPSGNGLSVDFLSCSVFCDSSDNKHYEVDPATYAVHGIIIYYQLFYKDGTAGEPTYYDASLDGIPVATNLQEVKFYLYGVRNGGADTSVVHDSQNVPIIAAGVDGESVEYVFFRQNFLTPYPTLYDDPNERQRDDYLPYTDENQTARWTDDAVGIDEDHKYEFYAIRRKINGVWQAFGDIMIFNQYHAAQYSVDLTSYVDVITVDDAGNVIGGLYTLSGANNEYKNYRIHSAITVRLGQDLLTEAASGADAGDGTFKIYAQPRGCSCVVENSTIFITGINNIKDGVAGTQDDTNFDYDAMREMSECSVDLVIDCEGRKSITKRLPITIKHDSQPFISADISNEFSGVSWNTQSQAYVGLPITFDFTMWHNDEFLNIENANNVSLSTSTSGVTLVNGAAPATLGASSIYYTKTIETIVKNQGTVNQYSYKVARITITAMGADVPLVTDISVTASAIYSGVTYERTLVHTINKSTDTNVYSLLPSASEIVLDKNTNSLNISTLTCSVICDSSDDKHYTVAYADFATHGIIMYYKKFYTNGTSDADETLYANTAISVDATVAEVRFYLYGRNGNNPDRTIVHDQEGVSIISSGENAIQLIIDNGNDTVMCLEDGTVIASTLPYAKVYLHDGNDMVNTSLQASAWLTLECIGCTAQWVSDYQEDGGKRFNVTAVTADVARVTAKVSYKSETWKVVHTIKKLYGLDKYEIITEPVSIAYNPNTQAHSPSSFAVYVYLTTQEEDRHLMTSLPTHSSATDGDVRLQYSVNNGSSWTTLTGYSSGKTVSSSVYSSVTSGSVLLRVQKYITGESGGEWITLDEEGVEITSGGENGDDAEIYYLTSDINSIVKDYTGAFKGSATPTITAWKKVGDNAAVRLADIVDGSVVAEGMTINAYEMNGNTIEYTNTSTTGVLTCAQPYQYVDRFEVELVKNSKTYATLSIPILQEVQGQTGAAGVFPRDRGLFKSGETYYYTKQGDMYIRDKVNYEIGGVMYGFLVKEKGSTVTAAPTSASGDSNWEASGIVETVIANTVFGTNANIGGFMASVQRFLSSQIAYYVKYRGTYSSSTTYYHQENNDGISVLDMVLYDSNYYVPMAEGDFSNQTPSSSSQYWRLATKEEIATGDTLNASIPLYKLELNGIDGIIKLLHADGYKWEVTKEGVQVLGVDSGRHLEIDPNKREIRIYDDDGTESVRFDGETIPALSSIFSGMSAPSITISNSSGSQAYTGNSSGGIAYKTELKTIGSFTTTGSGRLSLRITLKAWSNRQQVDNTYSGYDRIQTMDEAPIYDITTGCYYKYNRARINIVIKTYDGVKLIATNIGSVSAVSDGLSRWITISSNRDVILPAGTHKIYAECDYTLHEGSTNRGEVQWSGVTASFVYDFYQSRVFANGLVFGSSEENFVAIIRESNGNMAVKGITNNGEVGFQMKGSELSTIYKKKLLRQTITLAYGFAHCYNSNGTHTAYVSNVKNAYRDGGSFSIERQSVGKWKLTYPSGWSNLSLSNTDLFITVTAVDANGALRFACVGTITSTYCIIYTGDDDSANDDIDFYFKIDYMLP